MTRFARFRHVEWQNWIERNGEQEYTTHSVRGWDVKWSRYYARLERGRRP